MDNCSICNVEEYIKNEWVTDNPYICINGPTSGGCNNAQFWPKKPNYYCDTTSCQIINNSYYCNITTKNCEGSDLPPLIVHKNRFTTKEQCERLLNLCRIPSQRPINCGTCTI